MIKTMTITVTITNNMTVIVSITTATGGVVSRNKTSKCHSSESNSVKLANYERVTIANTDNYYHKDSVDSTEKFHTNDERQKNGVVIAIYLNNK